MKKKMSDRKRMVAVVADLLVSLCICLMMAGCRFALEDPPYLVSAPECVLSSTQQTFRFAGVRFSFHNTSGKKVAGFKAAFMVYSDARGGNPFFGPNNVEAAVQASVLPGGSATFEISLDGKLAAIPSVPYVIDHFYIKQITYEDGSIWNDEFGFWHAGSSL